MRGHFCRQIDRGGTVSAADNPDRTGLLGCESEDVESPHGGDHDAELGRAAKHEGNRPAQQGPEVREGADAHKDHWRQEFRLDSGVVYELQKRCNSIMPPTGNPIMERGHHPVGDVGHQCAEAYRQQEKRLVVFCNRQVD